MSLRTQSFAGIRPDDVLGFIAAQLVGAGLAYFLFCLVFVSTTSGASGTSAK
jgi:glycerol uptake facilitator-like aquaporin